MTHWLSKVVSLFEADTADLRRLAELAGGNPQTFYRGISLKEVDTNGQNLEGMEFADNPPTLSDALLWFGDNQLAIGLHAIKEIKKIKTQEERLAVLLRLILENRNVASEIVEFYADDKGKFATLVIRDLIDVLQSESRQLDLFGNRKILVSDTELAHIVFSRFRRGMQMNRVLLLYNMAKHLHHFPEINSYLKSRYQRSWSMYFKPYEKEIMKLLYGKEL
jgi:hypothetical protein